LSHITKQKIKFNFLISITFFILSCSKNTITTRESLNSDGKLLQIQTEEKSDIELHKSFYQNGNIEYEAEIRDGIPDGISKYWNDEGDLVNISHYENGKLHGPSIQYFKSGAVLSKTEYFYGEIHGVSETYHFNGKIKTHQVFKYGDSISKLLRFDENGNRIYQP